jgi:hypothetical protein
MGFWYARLRAIDVQILWPSCVKAAKGNLDHAKGAFAMHAIRDPAWLALGEAEMIRRIDQLELPQ